MGYAKDTFEKGLEENIKKYQLNDLFEKSKIKTAFLIPGNALGLEILITERHGETFLCTEAYGGYLPDVVKEPGDKLKVQNRTIGHVYADFSKVPISKKEAVQGWYFGMVQLMKDFLSEKFMSIEAQVYISAQESKNARKVFFEKKDSLTGVCNEMYFQNRLKVIERSEIVPVALIIANINDTKFFYDQYGETEGNRLLCIVANAIEECATDEYIIGRCGVDVFHIMIPLPKENEAECYCQAVKEKIESFEDSLLAPSVAMGLVYRRNVEEKIEDLLSDAEFEMLSDKMNMKQQPGYEERKYKGIM